MANLTVQQQFEVYQDFMKKISQRLEAVGVLKSDISAAVTALDSFLEANATTINNQFPVATRTGLTTAQKAELLAYVVLKRWGG